MAPKFPKPQRIVNEEVLERARRSACVVCGAAPPSDPSHIRTRGSGGPDEPWNVFAKCRRCHRDWGTLGPGEFFYRNPKFLWTLEWNGWEWDGRKLTHPGLRSASYAEGPQVD